MLSRSYLGRHIWQNVWADTVACQKLGTRLAGSSAFEDQSASDLEIKDMAPYDKIDWVQTMIVRKKGHDVLADPIFNKGTAFSHTERERLGIRGLLPPKVSNLTEQKKNILRDYREGLDYVGPEDLENWSISSEMVRRWRVLDQLQNRNETLFYNVLVTHITEMAPIIYTPTVGWVCMNYHILFQKPRGMYLCSSDRGEIAPLVFNWPSSDVDAIVITDGSRILGLGDLGLNGMGISVGKLDLYVAAGGFHPSRVMPIVVDVGTDNEALLNEPLYMGLKKKRMRGRRFVELMDEVVTALTQRYPNAVIQFEDFAIDRAKPLLERYRYDHLVFNDDIQGTACSALAGVYGALSVQNLEAKAITEQRIVIVGAGSAGMGVCDIIKCAMIKHGLTAEQASGNFWVVDEAGLITASRPSLKPHVQVFARTGDADQQHDGEALLSVVQRVKPTVLIGLSGAGPLFTQQVLEALNAGCQHQNPVVMPMSNPTARMECTAEQAQQHTGGRAVFASGSPQDDQEWNGETIASTQANNMYIFPGLALGAHLGNTKIVTDGMIMAISEALPRMLSAEERARRAVYPDLANIRSISAHMAVEVMKAAHEEGLLSGAAKERLQKGEPKLLKWVMKNMYYPTYKNIVYLPTGVSE